MDISSVHHKLANTTGLNLIIQKYLKELKKQLSKGSLKLLEELGWN